MKLLRIVVSRCNSDSEFLKWPFFFYDSIILINTFIIIVIMVTIFINISNNHVVPFCK